jgi:putative hydrolase of the HAD superfamily
MPAKALIFDLDETLVADIDATRRALAAAARTEVGDASDASPDELARAVWQTADTLWLASPHAHYAEAIGMASWEALWARFDGERPEVRALAEWAPGYRRHAWREALASRGVAAPDDALVDRLQASFLRERRATHLPFPDAIPALERLRGAYRLAILTNGDSGLQREKLAGANLTDSFAAVVASGDLGVGKPDPRIYAHTLAALGLAPTEAVMIGDNPINDVAGAQQVGMRAVWLNRDGPAAPPPHGMRPHATITTLAELDAAPVIME